MIVEVLLFVGNVHHLLCCLLYNLKIGYPDV